VVSARVAAQITHMLLGVVEEGTGRRAALGTYPVAGKTGTSRRAVSGRYESGHYWASFVGMFPAIDPQLVLVVKIDDPAGDYFGGATAAPVTRTILEAALATQSVALDRGRLVRRRVELAAAAPGRSDAAAPLPQAAPVAVVAWPPAADRAPAVDTRTVPAVAGLDLRTAVRTLHRGGLRVRVVGRGTAIATEPAAGAVVPRGSVVVVHAR
jgi:cell division protein FtsI (penicillin-binding protein 3)